MISAILSGPRCDPTEQLQESAADAVKPARRESMQKLVPFVVETSYSLKKKLSIRWDSNW